MDGVRHKSARKAQRTTAKVRKRVSLVKNDHNKDEEHRESKKGGIVDQKWPPERRRTSQKLETGRRSLKTITKKTTNVGKVRKWTSLVKKITKKTTNVA